MSILPSGQRDAGTTQRNETMSRKFFAGMICAILFFAAVALADSQSTKDLIKGTRTGDEAGRLRAIDTLGEEGGTTPEAISALTSLLKDRWGWSAPMRPTP